MCVRSRDERGEGETNGIEVNKENNIDRERASAIEDTIFYYRLWQLLLFCMLLSLPISINLAERFKCHKSWRANELEREWSLIMMTHNGFLRFENNDCSAICVSFQYLLTFYKVLSNPEINMVIEKYKLCWTIPKFSLSGTYREEFELTTGAVVR
jgi:hypothetical protein